MSIKKVCKKLYAEFGSSAVYEYAKRFGITDWRKCSGCNAVTPVQDEECLVCGQNLSNEPHAAEKEKFEFRAEESTDLNFPGLRIYFNGVLMAICEYEPFKKEVRTIAYQGNKDEPHSIIMFKKIKS